MRCAYISVAAAALCLDGVLALGSLHRGYQRDYRNTGRAVLTGAGEHHKVNRTGVSGKDHGHAYHKLDIRQTGGRCGAQYGRCPSDLCCSDYGYCGDSVDHCAPLFDCQPDYGVCGWPRAPPVVTTTSTTSTTSSTTSTTSTTSSTSTTPTTTSTSTSTTSTTISSTSTTSTSTSTTPTSTSTTSTSTTSSTSSSSTSQSPSTPTGTAPGGLVITTNGQCGNGTSCIGNANYGPCCSQFFWCGSSLDFCGAGCQSQFGACLGVPGQPPVSASNVTTIPGPTSTSSTSSTSTSTTSTTSTSAPPVITTTSTTSTTSSTSSTRTTSTTSTSSAPPTPTVVIPPGFRTSTDGTCGPGITCLGSTYGRCCSQFGWCGDGDQFCPYIVGCQSEYGYCDPRP